MVIGHSDTWGVAQTYILYMFWGQLRTKTLMCFVQRGFRTWKHEANETERTFWKQKVIPSKMNCRLEWSRIPDVSKTSKITEVSYKFKYQAFRVSQPHRHVLYFLPSLNSQTLTKKKYIYIRILLMCCCCFVLNTIFRDSLTLYPFVCIEWPVVSCLRTSLPGSTTVRLMPGQCGLNSHAFGGILRQIHIICFNIYNLNKIIY